MMAKITMLTTSSIRVKPRRDRRFIDCVIGSPRGQSVHSALDVRDNVLMNFAVSGLNAVLAGLMMTVTVLTRLTVGSLTVIVRVCGYFPVLTVTELVPT